MRRGILLLPMALVACTFVGNFNGPVTGINAPVNGSLAINPSRDPMPTSRPSFPPPSSPTTHPSPTPTNSSQEAMVSTLAGGVAIGFADGKAGAARFKYPDDIVCDASGNLYVSDSQNYRIRKISPDGLVTTLAGSGIRGQADGQGATAEFYYPGGLALDASGSLFVADGQIIRKITPEGRVTTLPLKSLLHSCTDLAFDSSGTLYLLEGSRIQKLSPEGYLTIMAGNSIGYADGLGTAADFHGPDGLTFDASGTIYVGDQSRIRKVTQDWNVTSFGDINGAFANGALPYARYSHVFALTFDASNTLYVAESTSVRKITPEGMVTTLAGRYGVEGYADGPGSAAKFFRVTGVAVDAQGTLYVVDSTNSCIRKIRQ